jgi:hypothetical protein
LFTSSLDLITVFYEASPRAMPVPVEESVYRTKTAHWLQSFDDPPGGAACHAVFIAMPHLLHIIHHTVKSTKKALQKASDCRYRLAVLPPSESDVDNSYTLHDCLLESSLSLPAGPLICGLNSRCVAITGHTERVINSMIDAEKSCTDLPRNQGAFRVGSDATHCA